MCANLEECQSLLKQQQVHEVIKRYKKVHFYFNCYLKLLNFVLNVAYTFSLSPNLEISGAAQLVISHKMNSFDVDSINRTAIDDAKNNQNNRKLLQNP